MDNQGLQTCLICGRTLPVLSMVKKVGGWPVCAYHKVYVKENKYASKCHECLGNIAVGSEVVLAIVSVDEETGRPLWAVYHPKHKCRPVDEPVVNNNPSYGSWSILYLVPGAPVEVVKAAYKALALKYHPDRPTGSESKMKELNLALDDLLK